MLANRHRVHAAVSTLLGLSENLKWLVDVIKAALSQVHMCQSITPGQLMQHYCFLNALRLHGTVHKALQ